LTTRNTAATSVLSRALKSCFMALLALAIVSTAFLAGFATQRVTSPAASAAQTTASGNPTAPDFQVFWEAWHILEKEFYGTLPTGQQVAYNAIRGVLATLDDPNTILVEPVQHEFEKDEFQGEFGGIGAYVSTDEQGRVVIVSPIDDTPASRAGLQAGDIILEVEGQEVTGLGQDQAILLIRGPVGTPVTLIVSREGEPDPLTFTLTRREDRKRRPSSNASCRTTSATCASRSSARAPRRNWTAHWTNCEMPEPRRSSWTCAATRAASSIRRSRPAASSSPMG